MATVDPSANIKLVNSAISNTTRRKIINLLKDGGRSKEEIANFTGHTMLEYHLQHLKQAGLVTNIDGLPELTDFGRNFLEVKAEKVHSANDLFGTRPVDVIEIRQFIPCIADNSKLRIIARMEPPLEAALRLMEPLFPRARYSEKLGILMIQKRTTMITVYSTGNVTMTMVSDTDEAKWILDDLRRIINDAIEKGITPNQRERIEVEHNDIYKYLPKTNCRTCGEQSCYSFSIRLIAKETTMDRCTPLFEKEHAINLEHLRVLMEYL